MFVGLRGGGTSASQDEHLRHKNVKPTPKCTDSPSKDIDLTSEEIAPNVPTIKCPNTIYSHFKNFVRRNIATVNIRGCPKINKRYSLSDENNDTRNFR